MGSCSSHCPPRRPLQCAAELPHVISPLGIPLNVCQSFKRGSCRLLLAQDPDGTFQKCRVLSHTCKHPAGPGMSLCYPDSDTASLKQVSPFSKCHLGKFLRPMYLGDFWPPRKVFSALSHASRFLALYTFECMLVGNGSSKVVTNQSSLCTFSPTSLSCSKLLSSILPHCPIVLYCLAMPGLFSAQQLNYQQDLQVDHCASPQKST